MTSIQPSRFKLTSLGWLYLGLIFCFFGFYFAESFRGRELLTDSFYGLGFYLLVAFFLAFVVELLHAMPWARSIARTSKFGFRFFFVAVLGYGIGLIFHLTSVWWQGGELHSGMSLEILLFGIALGLGALLGRWFFK